MSRPKIHAGAAAGKPARGRPIEVTSLAKCVERLAGGGAVVTANNRLARHIRDAYAQAQERRGLNAWPTADVLPWDAWIARLWETLAWKSDEALPVAPGETLEQELWRQVIDVGAGALLDVPAAARAAREAFRRLCGWRLSVAELRRHPGEEVRAFLRWQAAVEARCAREGWIEAARIPDELAGRLDRLGTDLPPDVSLAGFDELTPQQRSFLGALERAGSRVEIVSPVDRNRRVRRVQPVDAHAELETAARWARRLLESDPAASIGIVVPDLAERRDEVQRIFTAVLAPEAAARSSLEDSLPFAVSAGRLLRDYPPVHAAFLILRLARAALSFDEFGRLLRSPWLGHAESERARRAKLDARLRERQWLEISVERALAESGAAGDPHECPALEASLEALARSATGLDGTRLPGDWLPVMDAALAALGWPGERGLASHDYQTVEAFRVLERRLYGLGAVTGAVSYAQAVALLERTARATVFQPETKPVPVEILGVLEAAGREFDHLWVAGLHDEVWPAPARPNGFLPAAMQRDHGMPHASAERELEYATAVTARLVASAPNVMMSSPQRDQERLLRPSPLIRGYPLLDEASLDIDRGASRADALYEARALELLAHDPAPRLGDAEPARGGTSLLKLQAACGFRAFGERRLHAGALESPAPGINPRERGTLLHKALELLWIELGGQAALLELDEPARAAAIQRHVGTAAQFLYRRHPARLVAIETRRAERLVAKLLEVEAGRAPFTVERREELDAVEIGGLRLSTRADRVDRLEDGERLIIDYKTGQATVSAWWGPRPDEPQLPLYAVGAREPPAGVAFAVLRDGDAAFQGLAREAGVGPGIDALGAWLRRPGRPADIENWDAALAQWRATLERLARDYASGRADVDPKDPRTTCRLCHLDVFCRIAETGLPGEEDEVAG